jgi:hypothetical protein
LSILGTESMRARRPNDVPGVLFEEMEEHLVPVDRAVAREMGHGELSSDTPHALAALRIGGKRGNDRGKRFRLFRIDEHSRSCPRQLATGLT